MNVDAADRLQGSQMNKQNIAVLSSMMLFAVAGSANAAGCLKGAVVGGVAGHVAGHHAVIGAVGGCIVGHHMAKEKAKERAMEASQHTAATPS
jgi:uncharacterized protein YcfJ